MIYYDYVYGCTTLSICFRNRQNGSSKGGDPGILEGAGKNNKQRKKRFCAAKKH